MRCNCTMGLANHCRILCARTWSNGHDILSSCFTTRLHGLFVLSLQCTSGIVMFRVYTANRVYWWGKRRNVAHCVGSIL